jgi:serine/threonine-protein kinase
VLYEMLTGEVPFKGENQVAVAMKHVREQIPDVQAQRPAVSAALAAVLETATAKRLDDRYADDSELIADLEDVLAIETARAGAATGEVTTVLRTLPRSTRRRLPLHVRHPAVMIAGLMAAVAVAIVVVVFLANHAHHGAGKLAQPPPKATPEQIALCDSCATDYNPDAISGPQNQNPQEDAYAIDNNLNTAWTTQYYLDDALGKPGVGIYVDTHSAKTEARTLTLDTSTPGYAVTIYARRAQDPVNPATFDVGPNGWVKVGSAASVHTRQNITLATGDTPYRYYLVWITSLGNHESVAVNEIALFT